MSNHLRYLSEHPPQDPKDIPEFLNRELSRISIAIPLMNSGAATIVSGTSSVLVNHGLRFKPGIDAFQVTPTTNMMDSTKFWISGNTTSTFSINVDASTGSAGFVWTARIP